MSDSCDACKKRYPVNMWDYCKVPCGGHIPQNPMNSASCQACTSKYPHNMQYLCKSVCGGIPTEEDFMSGFGSCGACQKQFPNHPSVCEPYCGDANPPLHVTGGGSIPVGSGGSNVPIIGGGHLHVSGGAPPLHVSNSLDQMHQMYARFVHGHN